MAASESMRAALNDLNDELLHAKLMADAFSNLHAAIEAAPAPLVDDHAWVFVVSRTIDRIVMAAEKLECLCNQKAIPVLSDMEKLSSGSGR